jgi:hypothetical protein
MNGGSVGNKGTEKNSGKKLQLGHTVLLEIGPDADGGPGNTMTYYDSSEGRFTKYEGLYVGLISNIIGTGQWGDYAQFAEGSPSQQKPGPRSVRCMPFLTHGPGRSVLT